ncbi:hypothetical protein QA601_02505 [Chitinispirillales bacterium ANBcel5]|uniref:hypothetical protein n=1 Tax=Cellulosispirillum alkaliphilum TaxID=3039283 RepID=UPI002A53E2D8|nr:hypothetical protein [Chitinispirillales bacterium ANBcel5]
MNNNLKIEELVEEEIEALFNKKLKRPSMSKKEFLEEYSVILNQAQKDKAELIGANFDWTLMPKFEVYLEFLLISVGEAQCAILATPELKKEYELNLKKLLINLSILKDVARHIISYPKNADVVSKYNRIVKNRGDAQAATTTIDLIAFIAEYPEEAAQVCPCGVRVDEKYLDDVRQRALTLINTKGSVLMGGRVVSEIYSRQKKLITLSMGAMQLIRRYAKTAFVNNRQYYKDHYVSKVRRRQNSRYRSSGSDSRIETL